MALAKTEKLRIVPVMKQVLVISSFVAGSNVGGSLAMKVLPQLGCEVALLPTTLLGRHPGWGWPGGGAVPQSLFEGMSDGLIANRIPEQADVIITGYFASAEQVRHAAGLIKSHRGPESCVIVDTILGDFGKGLYVKDEVAAAMVTELLPLADMIKGNAWEFWEIERRLGQVEHIPDTPRHLEVIANQLQDRGVRARQTVVTSVERGEDIGLLACSDDRIEFRGRRAVATPHLPNGLGDFVTMMLALVSMRKVQEPDERLSLMMDALSVLLDEQKTQEPSELDLGPLRAIASTLDGVMAENG